MPNVSSILTAKKLICRNNINPVKTMDNNKDYDRNYKDFPFRLECSCTGDFSINCVVGVPFSDLKFKYEKILVPTKYLDDGFLYVKSELSCNTFVGSISFYKGSYDNYVDKIEFTDINDFDDNIKQCYKYIRDTSNIDLVQSILNGMYILTRQYNTDTLSFKGRYLTENKAMLQGYFEGDKIIITKQGVVRGDLSSVVGDQYSFKLTKTSLGIIKQDSLYLKKFKKGKPIYTSSVERSLKINISEYYDNYEYMIQYLNQIQNYLDCLPNISYEVIVNPVVLQVETSRLLKNLCLPFPNSSISAIKKVDTRELSNHSAVLSITQSYVEIYRKGKFMGYLQGYNPKTFEVRKTSLANNRLEWKTDSKLKCCNEEYRKLNELISNLSRSNVNQCYSFVIKSYTFDKFVLANELK